MVRGRVNQLYLYEAIQAAHTVLSAYLPGKGYREKRSHICPESQPACGLLIDTNAGEDKVLDTRPAPVHAITDAKDNQEPPERPVFQESFGAGDKIQAPRCGWQTRRTGRLGGKVN